MACIQQKCNDPCPGQCGQNAKCYVISHAIQCMCLDDFHGDPFVQCTRINGTEVLRDTFKPCSPSPCGVNALCRERNGIGACQCIPDYLGNPYEGCRPQCTLNSDCPSNLACQQQKCRNPCPGVCGQNAECNVVNHLPTCNCLTGYTGDPYRFCSRIIEKCKRFIYLFFFLFYIVRLNFSMLFLSECVCSIIYSRICECL